MGDMVKNINTSTKMVVCGDRHGWELKFLERRISPNQKIVLISLGS